MSDFKRILMKHGATMPNDDFSKIAKGYLKQSTDSQKSKQSFISELENLRMMRETPSPLASVGRGMMDLWQGGRDLLPENFGGYSPEESAQVADEVAMYERDKGGGFDGFRTIGQAVATAPLMAIPGGASANVAARTAAGATAGGLASGLLYEEDLGKRAMNVGLGVAAGGVLSGAAPAITRLAGKTFGIVKEAIRRGANWWDDAAVVSGIDDALNSVMDEAGMARIVGNAFNKMREEAKASVKATGAFDADALIRKAKMNAAGFVDDAAPTTGQITQDPQVMGQEYNISKVGDDISGPLSQRFAQQRARTQEILDGFKKSIFGDGADAVDPYAAVKRVGAMAQRKAGEWQGKVTSMYNKVPGGVTLNKQSLKDRTWQLLEDYEKFPEFNGLRGRINRILDDDTKAFTFDKFEALDKAISKLTGKSSDGGVRSAGGELKEALLGVLDDSEQAVAEGARASYRAAKKAAQDRFEAIGDPRKLLGQLASGSADENTYKRMIKSSTVDEVKQLMDFIDEPTRKWVRASVLNDIMEQSIKSGDYKQGGFNNALGKIGREKMRAIFGETAEQLKLFGEATEMMFHMPAGHSANFSHSGITNMNFVQRLYKDLIDTSAVAKTLKNIAGVKPPVHPRDLVRQEISEIGMSGGNVQRPPLMQTPGNPLNQPVRLPVDASPMISSGEILNSLRLTGPMGGVMGVNMLPKKANQQR